MTAAAEPANRRTALQAQARLVLDAIDRELAALAVFCPAAGRTERQAQALADQFRRRRTRIQAFYDRLA